jgi:hypothetical protein
MTFALSVFFIAVSLQAVPPSPISRAYQQYPSNQKQNASETAARQSSPQEQNGADQNTNRPNNNPHEDMPWWEDAGLATWVLAIIGFFGTLAALLTLCTLSRQTDAVENSVKVSNAAMRLDQRAWIGPTGIAMKQFVVGQKVDAIVETINSGKSPALKLVTLIGFIPLNETMSETLEPPDHNIEGIEGSETVCFPNQKYTVHVYSTAALSQAESNAINAKQLFFYIVGRLTYTDIFGDTHTTRIAAVYDPVVKGFNATQIGNTAD